MPNRSASTSCVWIVSRFTCREKTKSESSSAGIRVEHALEGDPDRILDEARLEMRVLDHEQLVGPLQELVDRRAHRALDDFDQLLRVHARLRADVERPAPALVVRRDRDELEDPLDVPVVEARLEQSLARPAAHEPLRARARIDARGLDADEPPHAPCAMRPRSRSARPSPASAGLSPESCAGSGSAPRCGRAPAQRALPLDDVRTRCARPAPR
mgnify:CR=1 FL=1